LLGFCKENPDIPCFSIDDKKIASKPINAGDGAALLILFAVSRTFHETKVNVKMLAWCANI
jgi:hypothetical protein